MRTLEEYEYLRDSCQVLVALTHIGSKYDRELADEASEYDLIIGGHSHERINEVEDGVLITQTGRNLNMVGVTRGATARQGDPVPVVPAGSAGRLRARPGLSGDGRDLPQQSGVEGEGLES